MWNIESYNYATDWDSKREKRFIATIVTSLRFNSNQKMVKQLVSFPFVFYLQRKDKHSLMSTLSKWKLCNGFGFSWGHKNINWSKTSFYSKLLTEHFKRSTYSFHSTLIIFIIWF
jgi:hypothetical protein